VCRLCHVRCLGGISLVVWTIWCISLVVSHWWVLSVEEEEEEEEGLVPVPSTLLCMQLLICLYLLGG
jgi:hypothetical protein